MYEPWNMSSYGGSVTNSLHSPAGNNIEQKLHPLIYQRGKEQKCPWRNLTKLNMIIQLNV